MFRGMLPQEQLLSALSEVKDCAEREHDVKLARAPLMPSDSTDSAKALFDPLRASFSRQLQAMPGYPDIFDSSAEWSLNAVAQMFPCKWVRELAEENRNKFHAFSEFQNTKRNCSGSDLPPDLFAGHPSRNIWRAEGLGAHLAELDHGEGNSVLLSDWSAQIGIPSNFLLPLHSGGGLTLAETTIRKHHRSRQRPQTGDFLTEFQSLVDQQSTSGLEPAVFEALGLVLHTMYPDLLNPAADYLREHNPVGYRLLWHGVGRGHYFDPFQMMVPTNLRDRSYLSDTDDAALNRLAGFAWTTTMINMRSPETAAKTLAHLPLAKEKSLAAAANGISAATLVWLPITDDRQSLARFEESLAPRDLFRHPSASSTIQAAIKSLLDEHPASPKVLGDLFSFDLNDG